MLKVFIFMCANFAVVISSSKYNYSEYRNLFTCEGRPHTFFVYQTEQPAPICFRVLQIGLKDEDKKKIVDLHNFYRQKVAIGEEKRGAPGPQPPARVMRDLKWDEELEDMAQRWANQCEFVYDQCRDSERFRVNQLALMYNLQDEARVNLTRFIDNTFYNSVERFNSSDVLNYNSTLNKSRRTLQYSQIVWADTKYIGCGTIKYTVPGGFRFLLYCNYGPAGNIDGRPLYLTF